MRLFRELNGAIYVIEYMPIRDKVIEYKKYEMESIPSDYRVLRAEYNSDYNYIKSDVITNSLMSLNYKLPNKALEYMYHKIECSELSSSVKKDFINNYIRGADYSVFNPHKISPTYKEMDNDKKTKFNELDILSSKNKDMLKDLKCFLTTSNYVKSSGIYIMEKIVNIPESLLLYHLLDNERYDEIDVCIKEQFELFSNEGIINSYNVDDIVMFEEELKKSGIKFDSVLDKLRNKVKKSEKILKLVRDSNN